MLKWNKINIVKLTGTSQFAAKNNISKKATTLHRAHKIHTHCTVTAQARKNHWLTNIKRKFQKKNKAGKWKLSKKFGRSARERVEARGRRVALSVARTDCEPAGACWQEVPAQDSAHTSAPFLDALYSKWLDGNLWEMCLMRFAKTFC